MQNAESIAEQLAKASRSGNSWIACCPAHDDKNPSLSLDDTHDGKVLVKCHAGCSQAEVIGELRKRGLWAEKPSYQKPSNSAKIDRKYDYCDENGNLLFQVVRLIPKGFRQQKPNGNGGWEFSIKNVRKVPYRLPELLDRANEPIFIVEGEKDVDALFDLGMLATCNAGGSGKWPTELNPHLKGRSVILIPDNDSAGHKHVRVVAEKLAGTADSIRVFDLSINNREFPEKGDVSDWLTKGGDETSIEGNSIPYEEWLMVANPEYEKVRPTTGLPEADLYKLGDPTKIPPRQFIYGRHYIRSFVTATGGVGGSGKSTIIVSEALAIATGKELLGEKVIESCPVWYVNLEDPKEELDRRIAATALHYNLTSDDLAGRLFVNSGRSSSFVLAEDTANGVNIVVPVKEALMHEIEKYRIGVLIIDPFVKVHRVSENANEQIDAVLTVFAEIAEATGVAIELVPHLRKGNGTAGAEEIRGASSFIGAVRSARIVRKMNDDEARKAGIDDHHRPYVRVDDTKANMAPPAEKTIWRKLVSVDLGNRTDTHPSDAVAVAEEWSWPDPLDDVSTDNLKEVQKCVAERAYRHDPQSTDWVGKVIAEVLELDIEDPIAKGKIKAILKIWISNGVLKIVKKLDDNRKERPFVEVGEWVK